MKKIGIVAVTLIAAVVFAQSLATDFGSKTPVNHSAGVVTFPFEKLQVGKTDGGYSRMINHYTTIATYPTTFVPTITIFHDGGAECYKYTMANTSSIPGMDSTKPLYCHFTVPFASLDAGVLTIFKALDGGYGLSQCNKTTPVPADAWPAFCTVQNATP